MFKADELLGLSYQKNVNLYMFSKLFQSKKNPTNMTGIVCVFCE